jgi:hypothetical protein
MLNEAIETSEDPFHMDTAAGTSVVPLYTKNPVPEEAGTNVTSIP